MFAKLEIRRLTKCLARLMPHFSRERVALTGSVAMELGLAARGLKGLRERIADLDLVVTDPSAIVVSVAESFLVFHYHLPQSGVPRFMLQLVDPVTRLRVDVFPDLAGSLSRAQDVDIGGQSMKILCLEDIFDHKVQTIRKASATKPVDPKHVRDAQILGGVLGRAVPRFLSGSVAKDIYGNQGDFYCPRCDLSKSASFPLAPRRTIFDLLGWVVPGDAESTRRE